MSIKARRQYPYQKAFYNHQVAEVRKQIWNTLNRLEEGTPVSAVLQGLAEVQLALVEIVAQEELDELIKEESGQDDE